MGETTNEHRIGGLEARMAIIEQSHLRLETKIEHWMRAINQKLGNLQVDLASRQGKVQGIKLSVIAVVTAVGWIIGVLTPVISAWLRGAP